MSILRLLKNLVSTISILTLFVVLVSATCAYAIVCPGAGGDFTVSSGTTAGQQTLDGGDTGTIEPGGVIETSGIPGIDIVCDNNTVINNGSIVTIGDTAAGIVLLTGTGNTVNNSGSISTMGDFANGIFVDITGNTVNNSGSISTMGDFAAGIFVTGGTGNTVTNSGSISTIGLDAVGILFAANATGNTINNYGGIFTSGLANTAIQDIGGSNNTLNIFPGSQIVGNIFFKEAGDVINIFSSGAGSSSTLTFAGTPTVHLKGGNMVNVGGIYTVVDPTGPSINGAALGTMMSGVHNVLAGRGGPSNPPQVASTRIEPGMMPSADDSQIWFSGFGSHRERDTDGSVLAYDHDYYGGVGGYEMALGRSSRIGFLAGYANTDLATDFQSLYTNTHSGFIGTYGQVRFGNFNLDASLIAGYEQNDNNRIVVDNINGFELAEADYDSFFISPSITLSSQYKVHQNIVLRPSATMTYSVAWYDDYTETGTTQTNLTIDDRTAHALVTKLQMVAAYEFGNGSEVGILAGGRFRYTMNRDVNATLAGTSFRYATSGDDTHFEALVGGHARIAVKDNLNLTINTQYALNNGVETNFSGQAGIEFIF
ncbi:MAG: autotransporter domain-containing protein [Nitrospinales bacterium]